MGSKKSTFTGRAWSMLRMALIWVRKGGALKHKWLLPSSSKGRHSHRPSHYGQRQLSFDETPAFRFKLRRAPAAAAAPMRLLSCVNPLVYELDDEYEEDREFFKWSKEEDDVEEEEGVQVSDIDSVGHGFVCEDYEEIDSKAEEFISKFYAQMKLQRQISFLQYNEMLERSCT